MFSIIVKKFPRFNTEIFFKIKLFNQIYYLLNFENHCSFQPINKKTYIYSNFICSRTY